MDFALAIAVFAGLPALWFLAPYAWRKAEEFRLRDLCRRNRAIVLTYDDGPGEYLTARLQDVLRDAGVRATFFLLGGRIDRFPETAAQVAAAGHEIGSHTYAHLNAWKTLPHRAERDFRDGVKRVEALGARSRLFRPPHGKMTLALLISVLRKGFRPAWWTLDSRDSRARRLDARDVIAKLRRRKGGVVLMHDHDGYRLPDHDQYVLALTRRIVHFARMEGYAIVTLGELLASGAAPVRALPGGAPRPGAAMKAGARAG